MLSDWIYDCVQALLTGRTWRPGTFFGAFVVFACRMAFIRGHNGVLVPHRRQGLNLHRVGIVARFEFEVDPATPHAVERISTQCIQPRTAGVHIPPSLLLHYFFLALTTAWELDVRRQGDCIFYSASRQTRGRHPSCRLYCTAFGCSVVMGHSSLFYTSSAYHVPLVSFQHSVSRCP